MASEVILPKVDMDMTTGTIAVWHVKDGDTVKKGQAIFDIETDKAAMEIESPADGVIRIGNAPVKAVLPIGTVVAMIYGAGEEVKPFTGTAPAAAQSPAQAAVSAKPEVAVAVAAARTDGSKARATPLARRIARQQGIALDAIAGTGPRGRILASDLASAKPAKPVAAPAATLAAGMETEAVRALYKPGSYSVTPLDGMRRTIAQRLVQSKQTVPHFYLTATCTLDELLAVRERLNAHAPKTADKTPAWKLSVNDFVINWSTASGAAARCASR